MSAKKNAAALTGYDVEDLSRRVTKALAVVQCAIDYACGPCDRHAPYLEPALSVAVELLTGVVEDMDKLSDKKEDTV